MDLKTAVQGVSDKIADTAGNASAEELAYLGTAIDRIGGRATVLEVVQQGDTTKAEIEALGDTTKAEIEALGDTTKAEIEAKRVSANTDVTDHADGVKTQSEADIGDIKDDLTAHSQTVITETTDSVNALQAEAQSIFDAAAQASLFLNHFFASQ